MNTDIVSDIPDVFSEFFIDLRDIKTGTEVDIDKARLVRLFSGALQGETTSINALQKNIHPSTNSQYQRGI